jgi:dUTP pyrophosphatase
MNFQHGATIQFVPLEVCAEEEEYLPKKKYPTSVGIDLFAQNRIVIPPRKRVPIQSGFVAILPYGTYGRIEDCSGIALNKGTHVIGQIVDRDYEGELIIIVANISEEEVIFERGEKIAQLIVQHYVDAEVSLLSLGMYRFGKVDGSTRGSAGLGVPHTQSLEMHPRN